MAKKYILFIILNGILCGTPYAQTTLNIQSDVVISDDAATTLREGNLKVRGSLVVGEGYAPGLYSAGIAGGSAGGDYSMAVGRYSNAGDTGGIALGESADAMGQYAIAYGRGTISYGGGGIAFGEFAKAYSSKVVAMGYCAEVSGRYSVSIGLNSNVGYNCENAIVVGTNAEAVNASNGIAIGVSSAVSAISSLAVGAVASASAYASTAVGYYASASAVYSSSFGCRTTSKSYMQTTIGAYNDDSQAESVSRWIDTDPIFVVGNGKDEENRSNAMVIYKSGDAKLNGKITANSVVVTEPSGGISMGIFGRQE